jgi:hypothetical protein
MSSALEDRAVGERRREKRNQNENVQKRPGLRTIRLAPGKDPNPSTTSSKPGPLDTHRAPEAHIDKTGKEAQIKNRSGKKHCHRLTGERDKTDLDSVVGLDALENDNDSEDEDLRPEGEETEKERVAVKRNRDRVEKANATDHKLTSKYLPKTADEFLPNKIPGPDDTFTPPDWLMEAIEIVFKAKEPVPKAPPVRFDLSEEAIRFNTELLKDSALSLQTLLSQHQDTTLGFGSEFRPVDQLQTILGQHPNFGFFAEVLTNGMDYRFTKELSDDERRAEVRAMLDRGNHKSVQEDGEEVGKLLAKDVLHGFSLPVSPDIVPNIEKAMVQPAGVVKQFSLREDGVRFLKRRLTQDLSFPLTFPGASVNNRIDMEAYVEMIYGWCLTRLIHFIVALRLAHPTTLIFIVKYDYSDGYRRIAHSASAAAQSIIVFAGVAYIALRLTFGGSPNPPTWCAFSEMVTDLSNDTAQ